MSQVYVRVDADDSRIVLQRRRKRQERQWSFVCQAPCDTYVPVGPGPTEFRFEGEGTRGSRAFSLQGSSAVTFDVSAGSQSQWVGGWVAVGVGGAAVTAGGIMYLVAGADSISSFGSGSSDDNSTLRGAAIGTAIAGLAIGVGLGLPLLLTSRTSYEIVDERFALEMTPQGPAFTF